MKTHIATVLALMLAGCPDESDDSSQGTDDAGRLVADAGADAGAHDADVHDAAVPDAASPADAQVHADTPGDYAALGQQTLTKYRSCSIYEPSVDPDQYTVEDGFDACLARCLLAAPCGQIVALFCDDAENAFQACIDGCDERAARPDGYRCQDGSVIPHAYLCDFEPDCAGSEDEQNCGAFACANGEVLPNAAARCDYLEDCADGSDEQGCALDCR